MNLHVEPRDGGALAFFLDGDLQFDSRDERLYHETLVLPALCLARPKRVLICGGGDGLALREALRFPGVEAVDLVDWSPETVQLGRTTFAPFNDSAFADPRVKVHTGDAWEFLAERPDERWDAIVCDFTVPRREGEARVYTQEWFRRLRGALTEKGIVASNACSPQRTPEAFACLVKTIAAAGLSPLPVRACIPSFFEQGYGIWGFVLAGRDRLRRRDLRDLVCPVEVHQASFGGLWRAARVSRDERAAFASAPVHTEARDAYVHQLLNPGGVAPRGPESLLDRLLRAIPRLHVHHTRAMVEAMAEQVVGTVLDLDIRRLTDELLRRAHRLPGHLVAELHALRAHLTVPSLRLDLWATRIFATLVLILTIANIVAPDNAYGKGSFGLGHASVSRGIGSFGRGSFGRTPSGFSSSTPRTGSFGRGVSGFAGSGRPAGGSFTSSGIKPGSFAPDGPVAGNAFRRSWHRSQPTDFFGTAYPPRIFVYRSGYYYHGGSRGVAAPAPESQPARFVADDDMMVLENGDVVLTVAPTVFVVVSQGHVTLHRDGSPEPILELYADPSLFENIAARLRDQRAALDGEIKRRDEWLAWVGWTGVLLPSVKEDAAEVAGMRELQRRLGLAVERIGQPADAPAPALPAADLVDAVELCTGIGLLRDGRVAVLTDSARWQFYTADTAPAKLKPALIAIAAKLAKEFQSDVRELTQELGEIAQEKASLDKDLAEYNGLAAANGGAYEVDYGTDSIPARDAISRTQKDLADNAKASQEDIAAIQKLQTQAALLQAYFPER